MAHNRHNRRAITAKQALVAANSYALLHFPTMYTGAGTHRLVLPDVDLWVVPIVLTHPDHGILGNVGLVAIDAVTGEVVGATPREEVVAAGKRVRQGKGYENRPSSVKSGMTHALWHVYSWYWRVAKRT